jgi:hypothetical protein
MSKFKTLVESFQEVNYPRVTRTADGNKLFEATVVAELDRLVTTYRGLTAVDQKARVLRDGIDFWLRRYHGFAIDGTIGAYYKEADLDPSECDFEHVIPQKIIRDMLIQGKLTPQQAMHPPTCLIHKDNHKMLKSTGWDSKTPSIWHFFDRYTKVFDCKLLTYTGQEITDPHDWTLEKHYKYLNIL